MVISMLSSGDSDFFARNWRSLVRQSEHEFRQWKAGGNVVFLQQACEKAFNALEQVTSLRSRQKFGSHAEFRTAFRKLHPKEQSLLDDADAVHRFFYNGLADEETGVIEERYRKVMAFVKKNGAGLKA